MDKCDFVEECPFYKGSSGAQPDNAEELKEKYCHANSLNCALFIVIQSLGVEAVPSDLAPGDKIAAYGIIAEKS